MIILILMFMFLTFYETFISGENKKSKSIYTKDNDLYTQKNYSVIALVVNDTIVDVQILDSYGCSFTLSDFLGSNEYIDEYVYTHYGFKLMKKKLDYIITSVKEESYYSRMIDYMTSKGSKIYTSEVYHFRANNKDLINIANTFANEILVEDVGFIFA